MSYIRISKDHINKHDMWRIVDKRSNIVLAIAVLMEADLSGYCNYNVRYRIHEHPCILSKIIKTKDEAFLFVQKIAMDERYALKEDVTDVLRET